MQDLSVYFVKWGIIYLNKIMKIRAELVSLQDCKIARFAQSIKSIKNVSCVNLNTIWINKDNA